MIRNVVLAVSTLAVLVIVFLAYVAIVGLPGAGSPETAMSELPRQEPTAEPLRIANVAELPPGGEIIYRVFDERTGRPTDMFRCHDWRPVPGTHNEIYVTEPELSVLLPSGMIATVSAAEGQLTVDRIERSQMKPKLGWLAGDVRIVVDRATGVERRPRAERPQDLITVAVERLAFDLELGELDTDRRVTVTSDDFAIAGRGLHLVWNQADNRVESLLLEEGEQFVLYAAAGLLPAPGDPPPEAAPAADAAPGPRHHPPRPRKVTTYRCTLTGSVVAERLRGEVRTGGLQADELRLLFDVGGSGPSLRAGPASAPAAERDRLVVRWNGSLRLTPADGPAPAGPPRRQLSARGDPVVLTQGDGLLHCGRLEFHDETRRAWLEPVPGGTIELGLGRNLAATAAGVFVDRAAGLVKLIGPVELRSARGQGELARISSIRSAYWAELHLPADAPAAEPAPGSVLDAGRLESATFVGDVGVDLGARTLSAHRLDVAFRPGREDEGLDELLDTATATGGVRLAGEDGTLRAEWLRLAFERTPQADLYPRTLDARGTVVIAREQSTVRGDEVRAELAPAPPAAPGQDRAEFVLRTLDILGRAELIDPDSGVVARGRHVTAAFTGAGELATAAVVGAAGAPALVHARPYTVRGARIDLDAAAQSLRVAGASRLAFKTRRSLQGQRRSEPTPMVVTAGRLLHVDGRRSAIRFEGDVLARSGAEQLAADTLTLLLEDVPEEGGAGRRPAWVELWRTWRGLLGRAEAGGAADDPLRGLGRGAGRARKEPLRLIADNALVSSASPAPGGEQPALHADISAPQLEVDIVGRQILTTGRTRLLMIDRRGLEAAEPVEGGLGLPSALLSAGPSQTAMQCDGRMTYALGPEGPQRRDTAVFEGAVFFVHRTGREMVNLEQMLPELARAPDLLDTLRSRNATLECDRLECWFVVDEPGGTGPGGGPLAGAPLRLDSLLASGNVYLRDKEGPQIREVNADRVEFARSEGRIEVHGTAGADARIYVESLDAGAPSFHFGPRFVINLRDGTIRSGELTGELRRR